jgi:hypothetical protein
MSNLDFWRVYKTEYETNRRTTTECVQRNRIGVNWRLMVHTKAEFPYDSVEFDVLDHFSIYFLHDPLDFVFTLAKFSKNR